MSRSRSSMSSHRPGHRAPRGLRLALLASVLAAGAGAGQEVPWADIVIDGNLEDWEGVPVAITDPVDAPGAAADFRQIRVTHDPRGVCLLVDFGRVVDLKGLDGHAELLLDTDGDPETGWPENGLAGVDMVVELSPPPPGAPGQPGFGFGLRVEEDAEADGRHGNLSVYAAGLLVAPTYATSVYEMRLERGLQVPEVDRPLFTGPSFRGLLVVLDLEGRVTDRSGIVEHFLTPAAPVSSTNSSDAGGSEVEVRSGGAPLSRPPGTHLRLVSWNVARDRFADEPDPFVRVLGAVAPDIVVLDELASGTAPGWLAGILEGVQPAEASPAPDGGWNVVVGGGDGPDRSAVASRWPVRPVPRLERIPWSAAEVREWVAPYSDALRADLRAELPGSVAATSAIVEIPGLRLLTVAMDLRCCGNTHDSPEEMRRRMEARAIRRAVLRALPTLDVDGVVLAGDLNLVGTRLPLDVLRAGMDVDGSDLEVVEPLQLDGLSNATWFRRDTIFPPGRLDFVLFSDSALRVVRSMVLDVGDLSERWLRAYGIRTSGEDDPVAPSDHLPVVVDLARRAPPAGSGRR